MSNEMTIQQAEELFGLSEGWGKADLDKAYREAVMVAYPEIATKNGVSQEEANAMFLQVKEAKRVLDYKLKHGTPPPPKPGWQGNTSPQQPGPKGGSTSSSTKKKPASTSKASKSSKAKTPGLGSQKLYAVVRIGLLFIAALYMFSDIKSLEALQKPMSWVEIAFVGFCIANMFLHLTDKLLDEVRARLKGVNIDLDKFFTLPMWLRVIIVLAVLQVMLFIPGFGRLLMMIISLPVLFLSNVFYSMY